ncbi:O-methyltransferase family 3 protein [Phlegmacium glaucopus]|nr:O-methyltransferase family 3 protein [Phlegmacium glaucopus]
MPSSIEDWGRSDEYHNSFLMPKDEVLDGVLKYNAEQGLPDIAAAKAQAKLLNLLAKSICAKNILEVGTLGGYSAIWLARALPDDGKLVTLEISPHFAKVAQDNVNAAGVQDKVDILLGSAAESLAKLNPEVPFDLVFIDADKASNALYFTEAKRLVRKNGVIIVDNVVWFGHVARPEYSNQHIDGIRKLLNAIKDDDEVEATTISTVGEKGYDGFLYAIKK